MPVVTHYSKQGIVRTISAIPPPNEVFEAVKRNFSNLEVVFVKGDTDSASQLAQKMHQEYGFVPLSVTSLFDIELKKNPSLTATAANRVNVLKKAISRACIGGGNGRNKAFVVNGFPKNATETELFRSEYGDCFRIIDTSKPGQNSFDLVKCSFQPLVVLVVGAKGSGVQAMASFLGQELGFTYLNVWDLLMAQSGGKAAEIQSLLARKRFPLQIALDLMKAAMNSASKRLACNGDKVCFRNPRFLIEGFPRRLANERDQLIPRVQDQWFAFEEQIAPIVKVIHLQCSDVEVRKARLASCETGSIELNENMEEIYENELASVASYASRTKPPKSCGCESSADNFVLEIDTNVKCGEESTVHEKARILLEPVLT